jgi:hypothetical protein
MMKKVISWGGLLSLSLCLMACTPRDEHYYRVHPKALQDAIAACPSHPPKLVSCETLHQIALRVNELVYELRMSPQDYGQKILRLQTEIVKQMAGNDETAKTVLDNHLQDLQERMAVVSWLESPTGT